MGCLYNDFQEGKCQMWDGVNGALKPGGCEDDGICVCDEDPNPEDSCEMYESMDRDFDDF